MQPETPPGRPHPVAAHKRSSPLRHRLQPGDLGRVITLHAALYAAEYGFDNRFEAYVADTLAEFGRAMRASRDRLWLLELDGRFFGSIGIIGREAGAAQLRWFLVHPDMRRRGLGRRLLEEALGFCRQAGCTTVYLWTVSLLTAAAQLYTSAGFRKTAEKEAQATWGTTVTEQRYDLTLQAGTPFRP